MTRHLSDLAEFERLCRRRRLALTVQRRAVLDTLFGRGDHPTADAIYQAVSARLRGISRATVYRVLQTLVDNGVARKVCHPGACARYELYKDLHHHLVCLHCGQMEDFHDAALNTLRLPDFGGTGFHMSDYSIQFRGLCHDCFRKQARRRQPGRRATPRVRRGRRVRKGGTYAHET